MTLEYTLKPTKSQLLEFVHELHDNLDHGQRYDTLIMDFSKAFDKLAHERLLDKLNNEGLSEETNRRIADFLSSRSQ